jgi:hypothetical protein
MTGAKACLILGGAALLIAAAGLILSGAWYHDDACYIEQWQCSAGTIGFSVTLFLGPLGLVLTLVGAVAWIVIRRRRGS